VAASKPVIVTNALSTWPAIANPDLHARWTDAYLLSKMGDREVTVDVTPTGHGDKVVGDRFVTPDEQRMKFSDFLKVFRNEAGPVYYIQVVALCYYVISVLPTLKCTRLLDYVS